MTEAEERAFYTLAYPAAAKAVAVEGPSWRGNLETVELLDWTAVTVALWRAGIARPGPTVGRTSYWWLHDAWRSWSVMFGALAPVVGPTWVEAVRRRLSGDTLRASYWVNFPRAAEACSGLAPRFVSPTSSAHLADSEEVSWARWADHYLMGEKDYSAEVQADVDKLHGIVADAGRASMTESRDDYIRSVVAVSNRYSETPNETVADVITSNAEDAIDAIHELFDSALGAEITSSLSIFAEALKRGRFDEARSAAKAAHTSLQKVHGKSKIRLSRRVRHAVLEFNKMLEEREKRVETALNRYETAKHASRLEIDEATEA